MTNQDIANQLRQLARMHIDVSSIGYLKQELNRLAMEIELKKDG